MARTFMDSNHMVLTTRSGPTEADIERRVVRNVATGRIIDECRPEDTPDVILMRPLATPTTIRVELTLKSTAQYFKRRKDDVVEMYSPPRIVQEVGLRQYGGVRLKPGWSLDLTLNDPVTKQAWDFTKSSCRQRAWEMVQSGEPFMLIGSPPCTAFSSLQN